MTHQRTYPGCREVAAHSLRSRPAGAGTHRSSQDREEGVEMDPSAGAGAGRSPACTRLAGTGRGYRSDWAGADQTEARSRLEAQREAGVRVGAPMMNGEGFRAYSRRTCPSHHPA